MTDFTETVFYAPDAEMILAAVVLRSSEVFPDRFLFLDDTTAQCFSSDSLWKRIYEAGLLKDGSRYRHQSIDAIRDYLGVTDEELKPLFKYMNRPVSVLEDARTRVLLAAQRRSLYKKLLVQAEQVKNSEILLDTLITETTKKIFDVAIASKKPGKTVAELSFEYGKTHAWAHFPKPVLHRSDHGMDATPFGMGAYNVFLAPPGTGKTVLALWKAVEIAQQGGYVLWNGWEMDGNDMLDMIIARFTGIPFRLLMDAREGQEIGDETLCNAITPEQRTARDAFLGDMYAEGAWGHRIRFLTGSDALSLNALLPLVRRLRVNGLCDLLVIDHLHIAQVLDEKGAVITDEVKAASAASRLTRTIALETGVPIFAAGQLNRSRKDAKQEGDAPDVYRMDHIRGHGSIEQDAFGITVLQVVQYNPQAGRVIRYTPPAHPPRKGERDPNLLAGYTKAIMGQVLKNRKGGGRLTSWVMPMIEDRFDFDMSPPVAARYEDHRRDDDLDDDPDEPAFF